METAHPTYLFFDCETTGLKPEYDNLVQLAAILTDSSGKELETMDEIIQPNGFYIPAEKTAIHGISHQMAMTKGVALSIVLNKFFQLVTRADYLVAHNFIFDFGFVAEEAKNEGMEEEMMESGFSQKESYCTMETTREFVGLGWKEQKKRFKRPNLQELHWKLFGKGFKGAHNALIDTRVLIPCFFELRDKHGFYIPGGKDKTGD